MIFIFGYLWAYNKNIVQVDDFKLSLYKHCLVAFQIEGTNYLSWILLRSKDAKKWYSRYLTWSRIFHFSLIFYHAYRYLDNF